MSKKGLLSSDVKETKTYENITIIGFNYALVKSKIVFTIDLLLSINVTYLQFYFSFVPARQ